jgi:hypothetical protein
LPLYSTVAMPKYPPSIFGPRVFSEFKRMSL